MNSQTSRKIIVAGGMAAVVGIGVAIFALRSHPVASVAQTPQPPTPVAQIPAAAPDVAAQIPIAAPEAAAQIPAAPPAVAQIPDTPVAVVHNDSVGTKGADAAAPSAVEHKLAHNRRLAKADTSAVATNGTATRTESAADTSEKPAAEPVANSVDRVKSADESTTPPATSSSPADDQKVGTSTEFAAPDSQIPPK
jgi:hypothetical protein